MRRLFVRLYQLSQRVVVIHCRITIDIVSRDQLPAVNEKYHE
jgi:hypothetical protein